MRLINSKEHSMELVPRTLENSLGEIQSNWQIQEMELELMSVTAKMPTRSLRVAKAFLEGHSLLECGTIAQVSAPNAEELRTKVGEILRQPMVKAYLDLAKQMMTARLMQRVTYDKSQWMQDMLTVLGKAMGKEDVNVVTHFEGTASSDKVKKDDLAAAKATLELIGKSQGWLVDNKNVQVTVGEKVRVRDFSYDRELTEDEDKRAVRLSPDLSPRPGETLVHDTEPTAEQTAAMREAAIVSVTNELWSDDDDTEPSDTDTADTTNPDTADTAVPDWE